MCVNAQQGEPLVESFLVLPKAMHQAPSSKHFVPKLQSEISGISWRVE